MAKCIYCYILYILSNLKLLIASCFEYLNGSWIVSNGTNNRPAFVTITLHSTVNDKLVNIFCELIFPLLLKLEIETFLFIHR